MSDRQSPENINGQIDYIRTKKIKDVQNTIDFYEKVGAAEDLTRYKDDIAKFEKDIINLENLLKEPKKLTTIKVKVSEYKGIVVVDTVDPDDFDQDYVGYGQGRIGCILMDNSRLAISQEALDAIDKMKRNRDCIGDFSGDAEHFSWIGGPNSAKDSTCEVSRDFRMPKGFKLVDNVTSQGAKDHIDEREEINCITYSDITHDLWIELRQGSAYDHDTKERTYEDKYTLNVIIQESYIYDKDTEILNAPDGMVINREEGSRKVKMSQEHSDEITKLAKDILTETNEVKDIELDGDISDLWDKIHRKGSVHKDDIMLYVNGLYGVGFFNNIMNPQGDYWRMTMTASPAKLIESLKKFKIK